MAFESVGPVAKILTTPAEAGVQLRNAWTDLLASPNWFPAFAGTV